MKNNQEYDNLNQIKIDTYNNLCVTCCNMAIGLILKDELSNQNIDKHPEFNLRTVKNSMQGNFILREHKPIVIEFLKKYFSTYERNLTEIAAYYYCEYKRLTEDENGLAFLTLASKYNTNIYPEELGLDFDSISDSIKEIYNKLLAAEARILEDIRILDEMSESHEANNKGKSKRKKLSSK